VPSSPLTIRVDSTVKKRLEKLARSTGRSRSFLAAEALSEYLDLQQWQVEGIAKAMGSLDRGEAIPHAEIKRLVRSWGHTAKGKVRKRA
jgi:RHH-type transcriptional regulator, rel operon repressor / antitoxin RelB